MTRPDALPAVLIFALIALLLPVRASHAQASGTSGPVVWTCTGSPCPWGGSLSGNAVVWPASLGPVSSRLGYTTSAAIYVPGSSVAGQAITISSGSASVFAGLPGAGSHRLLASLSAGQSYTVAGLAAGEVLSVQNDLATFSYSLAAAAPATPTSATATASPTAAPPACTDPLTCDPVSAIRALWRCNAPTCSGPDWQAAVVSWPSWAAYSTNGRTGNNARRVFDEQGQELFPYMGAWASGCTVTAVSGQVLIIEWERGTDVWRETLLDPGESHTITVTAPENGAMIESLDYAPGFEASIENCVPQPIS